MRLRHETFKFYKCEKCLGFLKGHGFDSALERILSLGYLPTVVMPDALAEDESIAEKLHIDGVSS